MCVCISSTLALTKGIKSKLGLIKRNNHPEPKEDFFGKSHLLAMLWKIVSEKAFTDLHTRAWLKRCNGFQFYVWKRKLGKNKHAIEKKEVAC